MAQTSKDARNDDTRRTPNNLSRGLPETTLREFHRVLEPPDLASESIRAARARVPGGRSSSEAAMGLA